MATAFMHSEELWRECATWLTKLNVLRNDHRVNTLNASIVDLANTLRDGVVLCILLNKLDANCLDMKDVNMKPVSAQVISRVHSCNISINHFNSFSILVFMPKKYKIVLGGMCTKFWIERLGSI